MGPPPKYLIQRKLVRSMIKKVIPKNPLLPQQYWDGLFKCWKVHGIGSNKCVDQQMKYDFAKQSEVSFRQKIEKMGIKSAVTGQLSRPSYWHEYRGRHYQYRMKNRYIIQLTSMI